MFAPPHRGFADRSGLALIAGLAVLAACDRSAPAPAAQAPAPAPTAAQSKPTFTLIMTWMYGAQPPQTTQTAFHDEAACDQARDAAIAEGRRLALESVTDPPAAAPKTDASGPRRYIGSALLPIDGASPSPPASAPQSTPPKVAAICAAVSTP
jgi:hypothetical protein